jgi:two-component system CheB/CheR fusion protein
LRNILHQAQKTKLPARKFAVFFKFNGLQHFVNIQAVPLKDTADPYYLIVFQNASSTGIQQIPSENNYEPESVNYDQGELRIEQLEKELTQARADMRTITEEQETANEELQSANEELLSGSEELQSLNEELETSKEELQSTNEEIMIVNKELLDRNDQLNSARQYAEGIVNTVRDPLIILDKNLEVKRATTGFYEKFKTTERDTEGHFVYDLGNRQWDIPLFRELLEKVLPEKKEISDFEITHTFPLIGKRTMLLNARQIDNMNGEQLILVAIEDVTDEQKVEQELVDAKYAIAAAGLGSWDYDPKNGVLVYDKRCREIFELSPSGLIDVPLLIKLIHAGDRVRVEKGVKDILRDTNGGEFDLEFRVLINEKIKWLKTNGRAYFNKEGAANRFVGTLSDITASKVG